ncbi:MAG: UDP-N-acetylmuramate--L-alanine ligase [Lachnospiraceae bacterium]|nr:UDP-N-acetylmuramate--L-alanine ligase [Lachnospiraceae bacterium]
MNEEVDFKNKKHIHFIGIGGISMSGLAELLCSKGLNISGSDRNESPVTRHLASLGVKVMYGQAYENITPDIDLIVYTAAISSDNPEMMAAKDLGIATMTRATLLGLIMKDYDDAICVAGTHGKTTTTSMLSHVYLQAGVDPTIHVGGILKDIKGNIKIGSKEHFITEACEYTNSFHEFFPTTAIILNVEAEHLDFFKTLANYRASFKKFIGLLPDDGLLIINGAIDSYKELCEDTKAKIITYGVFGKSDYYADEISFNKLGHGSYTLCGPGGRIGRVELSVVGEHNISNSVAAAACALTEGLSFEAVAKGLKCFTNADKRFQYKGERDGVVIIDDYAHHPTEIKATLNAALKVEHNKLWVAFQPHTYSRTKAFLNDFIDALSIADGVVLADIYAAREDDPGDISSKDIMNGLVKKGVDCTYFDTFEKIENFLINNCKHGDLLITMGAGNIAIVGEKLLLR